ncbi:MAG: TolC family protein [Acidobacteria bacterium]|nr:TolC family protein [Acidobacteriota bacterium]
MRPRAVVAIAFLLLAGPVPVSAEPADPFTAAPENPESAMPKDLSEEETRRPIDLAEVLALAERQSLEGRRAGARTRIAGGEAAEARLAWIPDLTASAGIGRTDGQVQGSFGDFRDVDFRAAAPFGRLAFGLNPGEAWLGASAAGRRAGSARAQEEAVRRLVLVRVAELYYELLEEKAGVEISRLAVQDARDLLRITEVLLRQGLGRGDDAERARVELANAEQRLLQAERRFRRASINLAAALDLDPSVVLSPREDAVEEKTLVSPDDDPGPLIERALAWRPEIAAAREELEAVRSDRAGAIAGLAAPRLEVFYQDGATGERYGDLSELRRYGVSATWTVSVGGMRGIRTFSARTEDAALALRQAEQDVRTDVEGALIDTRTAATRTLKARQALEAARSALRISQVRFRNGAALAIEVLQAEQALEQARLSEVAALVDYNQAQVRLRSQVGPLAPADLAAPPAAPTGPAAPAGPGNPE